jgi:Arc/MetJ-type ribon-helix-helix transcriptional regulator
MSAQIQPLPEKSGDSEKITINLGYVDLGRIDLMVQEGFYSNRTDFIRTAIRSQLVAHADTVAKSVVRRSLELGLRDISRAELETARSAGVKLDVRMIGLARIAPDVSAELALATIESLTVLGALQASAEVKSALAARIK